MIDTPLDAALDVGGRGNGGRGSGVSGSGKNVVVDLELEARVAAGAHVCE